MKKFSCLIIFLLFSCAISFSLADVTCSKEKDRYAYKCKSSTGELDPSILEIHVSSSDAIELDLSKNKLNLSDGSFRKFWKLQTLILSDGGLSGVTRSMFRGLNNLKTLDLSSNNIKELPSDVFDDMNVLSEVRLQHSKLDCSCEKGLMSLLTRRNISLGSEPAKCNEPSEFRRERIVINEECAVNECHQENDCDDVATCKDETKGYKCECQRKGFQGTDGTRCTDINECATGEAICAKRGGQCINTHGSYKCSCKKGFSGTGKRCNDVNECDYHDCGQGECSNTDGSFLCECHKGYEVNENHVCVDIDECKSKNNSCADVEHSYCFNVEKFLASDEGYHCLCEKGYRQVGRSCVAEGDMQGLIKMLGFVIGGFFGILFLIIIVTVVFRKWRNKKQELKEKEEAAVVVAPVTGLDPLMDFALLGMPQAELGQEDWGDLYEDDDEY